MSGAYNPDGSVKLGPNHEKALTEAKARADAPQLRPGVTVSPEDFVRGGKPLDLKKADVFYRLTTSTGPAALEELKVLDGKVVSRRVVEPKNVRAIILERFCTLNDGSGE